MSVSKAVKGHRGMTPNVLGNSDQGKKNTCALKGGKEKNVKEYARPGKTRK